MPKQSRQLLKLSIIALIFILALVPSVSAQAQAEETEAEGLGSFRFPAITPSESDTAEDEIAAADSDWTLPYVIVDTDTGVDDAAALAWLFYKAGTRPNEIVGIATVAGNATVDDATENVLLLMAQSPFQWWPPVYRGAEGPMKRSLSSTGKLLHGVDGLGYVRNYAKLDPYMPWVDGYLPRIDSKRAAAANDLYCSGVSDIYDEITVVALGPLTNIASAIKKCPKEMAKFRYVILGGARGTGNMTPSAEYNFWQDPEATSIVFNSGLDITVIPRERFDTFTLNVNQIDNMLREYPYPVDDKWARLSDTVGSALCWYTGVQSADYSSGDIAIIEWLPVSVPDPSAMMYALQPSRYGAAEEDVLLQIPFEKTNPEPGLVRGESVIGYFSPFPEALTMVVSDADTSAIVNFALPDDLADPFEAAYRVAGVYSAMADLQSSIEPNASIPSRLYGYRMRRDFLQAFSVDGEPQRKCFPDLGVASASGLGSTFFNQIIVPDPETAGSGGGTLYIPSISN